MAKKQPTANEKPVKTPRKLKVGSYKSFHLQGRIKTAPSKIPGSFQILRSAIGVVGRNPKLFGGIVLVYSVLCIVLVQSLSGSDVNQLKSALHGSVGNRFGAVFSGLMLYVYTSSTSNSSGNTGAGAYQMILSIMTSLAIIWALRQVYAKKKIRIRDGFYFGIYPIVPFILVLLVVLLELVPLFVGGFLYGIVMTSIASTGVEEFLWLLILFGLAMVTLYLLTSSLFALYIVCLPGTTPMVALRSARKLVAGRRWIVMRKVIFLPIALLIIAAICVTPIIFLYAPAAPFVFLIASAIGLILMHSYMYRLYRDLI